MTAPQRWLAIIAGFIFCVGSLVVGGCDDACLLDINGTTYCQLLLFLLRMDPKQRARSLMAFAKRVHDNPEIKVNTIPMLDHRLPVEL